jgi:hypothetical protein
LWRGIRLSCAPLCCFLSVDESPRQIRIRDADSSWYQSSNGVRVVLTIRGSGRYPHVHAVLQHGGNVAHAHESSLGDEIA